MTIQSCQNGKWNIIIAQEILGVIVIIFINTIQTSYYSYHKNQNL